MKSTNQILTYVRGHDQVYLNRAARNTSYSTTDCCIWKHSGALNSTNLKRYQYLDLFHHHQSVLGQEHTCDSGRAIIQLQIRWQRFQWLDIIFKFLIVCFTGLEIFVIDFYDWIIGWSKSHMFSYSLTPQTSSLRCWFHDKALALDWHLKARCHTLWCCLIGPMLAPAWLLASVWSQFSQSSFWYPTPVCGR